MWNLLTEQVIHVQVAGNQKKLCSLPEIFSLLCNNEIVSFPHLAAYQKQSWYSFLIQLAGLALATAGSDKCPDPGANWLSLIRNLTGKFPDDQPWHLVVNDLSQPAFLQPPVPENSLKEFDGPFFSADENDILVTSKNHDVKMRRIIKPEPDHWVYSLVNLQTMQGYLGLGKGGRNYGISRMNGGFGSRPLVHYTKSLLWGESFKRDLSILLKERQNLIKSYNFREQDGVGLLWLLPWDGKTSLSLTELDPFYIEICRRVRLTVDNGKISLYRRGTTNPRIASEEINGNTGDPWTPVHKTSGKSLTVSKTGFEYRLMQKLLFSNDYSPGVCQKPTETDTTIRAVCLARGQGQTQGFHERIIPIDPRARSWFIPAEKRNHLGWLSGEYVKLAALIRQALRRSIKILLKAGREKAQLHSRWDETLLSQFDSEVDQIFFPFLWAALEKPEPEQLISWQEKTAEIGRKILSSAEQSLPLSTALRYKAVVQAQAVYQAAVRKISQRGEK